MGFAVSPSFASLCFAGFGSILYKDTVYMKKAWIISVLLSLLVAFAHGDDLLRILVVHSYHTTLPWTASMQDGLARARQRYNGKLEYYTEYLDIARLVKPVPPGVFKTYLSEKYKDVKFDAVLADSDVAAMYVDSECGFLGDIPHVYYSISPFDPAPYKYVLISQYNEAIMTTLNLITEQNPSLRKIVTIESADPSSKFVYEKVSAYAAERKGLSVGQITDFSIDELYERVSALSPDTAILYSPVTKDDTGRALIPREVLGQICLVTDAKIYTMWSSLIGTGAIGGYMIDGSKTAEEMIRAVMDYLSDGKFKSDYNNLRMIFDWAAMKRYGIDTGLIPPDSIIVNKPVSFFITYFNEIIVSAAVLVGILLIISLMWIRMIVRANTKLKIANEEIEEARQIAENLARRDSLTGLYNRRAIMPVVMYEMQRKKRVESRVSIMILDIDHFKDVNDTYGHDVGDTVLKSIAETLGELCRSTDSVSRWGGEEFLILTPDTSGDHAFVLAEKIRISIEKLQLPSVKQITASIGVAELQTDEKFEHWFQRADACLYTAKLEGRNRSELCPETEIPQEDVSGSNIFTQRLQWQNKYMSGNDTIDFQHQELFRQSNLLIDNIVRNESRQTILETQEKLYAYAAAHFRSEAEILKGLQYEKLAYHLHEHTRLLREFDEEINRYKNAEENEYEIVRFIFDEIVLKHIIEEDMKYFPLFKS